MTLPPTKSGTKEAQSLGLIIYSFSFSKSFFSDALDATGTRQRRLVVRGRTARCCARETMKRQRTVSVPLRSTISSSSIAFILLLIQQQQRLISAEEQVDVDDDEYYDSAGQQQDDYQATDDDTTNDSSGDDRIAKYSSQPKGVWKYRTIAPTILCVSRSCRYCAIRREPTITVPRAIELRKFACRVIKSNWKPTVS